MCTLYVCPTSSSDPEVSGCPELFSFLEVGTYSVVEATSVLAQHLFNKGELECSYELQHTPL